MSADVTILSTEALAASPHPNHLKSVVEAADKAVALTNGVSTVSRLDRATVRLEIATAIDKEWRRFCADTLTGPIAARALAISKRYGQPLSEQLYILALHQADLLHDVVKAMTQAAKPVHSAGETFHRVKLSNGRVLLVTEGAWDKTSEISLALEGPSPNTVDTYICSFDRDGVLVMPNSGDATRYLTDGLKAPVEPAEPTPAAACQADLQWKQVYEHTFTADDYRVTCEGMLGGCWVAHYLGRELPPGHSHFTSKEDAQTLCEEHHQKKLHDAVETPSDKGRLYWRQINPKVLSAHYGSYQVIRDEAKGGVWVPFYQGAEIASAVRSGFLHVQHAQELCEAHRLCRLHKLIPTRS